MELVQIGVGVTWLCAIGLAFCIAAALEIRAELSREDMPEW
mgnify:FL=1